METKPTETLGPARKWKPFCLLVAAILSVLLVACVEGIYLWQNRPIKPVELSAKETQALEQKIDRMEAVPGEPQYEQGQRTSSSQSVS